jgi:hypothetical protein
MFCRLKQSLLFLINIDVTDDSSKMTNTWFLRPKQERIVSDYLEKGI